MSRSTLLVICLSFGGVALTLLSDSGPSPCWAACGASVTLVSTAAILERYKPAPVQASVSSEPEWGSSSDW
ncbi:hypothetical protein [Leptolyngbya sp. FACHB-261]|uniref:hypothetical protein n=1 Tax=Leptolyngbya sp. FACHB-261 TaxID=2692806 RepID=UPI0016842DB7|nr:hypothetical protein [Leptolyngbya sp. FACHB-261]MBD2101892.1 hypothetical protein [Leptolyngbya sp. FACHB-261]